MLVENIGHLCHFLQVPARQEKLICTIIPYIDIDSVPLVNFDTNNTLKNYLVAGLVILLSMRLVIVNPVPESPFIFFFWQCVISNQILIVFLFLIKLFNTHLVNLFLDYVSVMVADHKRRNPYRSTFTIISHVLTRILFLIDNYCHDGPKLLNVLHFLYKMTISAVNHDDGLVAIERLLL